MDNIEIVASDEGNYRIKVTSHGGDTFLTIVLGHVEDATDGRLRNDEGTARAALRYLLGHQETSDLPELIDVEDVLVAYPDAIDRIEALRD